MPGIYTKLLDVDKVDLVVGGYATNQNAPAMPVIIRKNKTYISLFALDVNGNSNIRNTSRCCRPARIRRARSPKASSRPRRQQNPKPKTVALAMADAEFSQNACDGARENAKKGGLKIVYDKSYPPPPKTTDFTPVVRALQAANADLVVVCSYPADSVGIVESANEIGLEAEDVRRRDGRPADDGVQGQAEGQAQRHRQLRDLGAGREADVQRHERVLRRISEAREVRRRRSARLLSRRLGLRAIPNTGDAIKGANSIDDDKIADYLKKTKFETIMGPIKYGAKGEWAEGRMLQVQYHDIKPTPDLETWRGMSYQTVLTPKNLETGTMVYPYEKAHQ